MNLALPVTNQALEELAHKPILKKLAESWLTMGAASFEIRDISGLNLLTWTATNHAGVATSEFSAVIQVQGTKLGELVVKGLDYKIGQNHLENDVALLLHALSLENELEELTNEYVSAQDQLLALYDLADSMRHHVTLQGAFKALVSEAARLTGAENAFIFTTAPLEEGLLFANELQPGELLNKADVLYFWKELKGQGKNLVYNSAILNGISNLFFTPIEIRGEKVAGLGLFNKPQIFTSPDIKLVQALAQQAGAQLDNMLLYQDSLMQAKVKAELDVAAQIQAQLLNHKQPIVEDLDFHASFSAAREIGGDFFDFVNLPDRPFVFGLGDVTGKGIPAALLMTMCRVVLHNASKSMPLPSPKAILSRMSEDLYDDFDQVRRFATIFVGNYDKKREILTFANAGHSPVILLKNGCRSVLLEADGPPLGVLTTILSEDESIPFLPGDILIVASDGFSEATNAQDEMFGYERLLTLVESLAALPAKEIAEKLFQQVQEFSGNRPQDDDQTLIVLKRVTK